MIKAGTRIIVLTSSLKRKIGPRVGSIGYVAQIGKPGENIFHSEKENILVHLTRVIFTQYGFEKNKQRDEAKFFLNTLPLSFERGKMSNDIIDQDITKVGDIETSSNFWEQLKAMVTTTNGQSSIHNGILVPLPFIENNLLQLEAKEFRSWLKSLLMDYNFYKALSVINNAQNRVCHVLNFEQIRKLRNMAIDKGYRDAMLDSNIDRVSTINTIRRVMSIIQAQEHRQNIYKIKRWLMKSDLRRHYKPTLTTVLSTLATDLYSDTEFSWKKAMIRDRSHNNINTVLILNYFSKMKNRLKYLAQILEAEVPHNRPPEDTDLEKKRQPTICKERGSVWSNNEWKST